MPEVRSLPVRRQAIKSRRLMLALPEVYNLKVSTLREPRVILPPKGKGGSRGGEAERELGGY